MVKRLLPLILVLLSGCALSPPFLRRLAGARAEPGSARATHYIER